MSRDEIRDMGIERIFQNTDLKSIYSILSTD